MDISNNHLTKSDFEIISEALKDNHTMYGFHFEGNYGLTDEKMFLIEPSLNNLKIEEIVELDSEASDYEM